jgi:5,10-methylenetetrahydromethanopterin reductase
MTSGLAISVGLAPQRGVVDHARAAERLGYERVWLFDSPAVFGDLWIAVARVAEATERIGVGTSVAVPSLRHPMVTAAAIASVEELAPGRLRPAFGTGFTARKTMGRKPMRWADLQTYVLQLRGLLAGAVVEIDGEPCQMLHTGGWAPPRPIPVPLWIAPSGPKGFAVADAVDADGLVLTGVAAASAARGRPAAIIVNGTVLRPGEDHGSARVVEAAGPWFAASFHATWEFAPDALDQLPGGAVWRDAMLAARPERERHLAVHEGHVVALTARDRAAVAAAGPALLRSGWTGDGASVRAQCDAAQQAGVTEIIYTPAGPDIEGELASFMEAASA